MSLDWKWLFIYPHQGVASVNQLVVPAGVPLHFTLTSASVLNTFFVPQLGSMIYTMNGMATELYLHADEPGTYHGQSAHFSGDGFSDMHFPVRAVSARPSSTPGSRRRARRTDRSTRPATPRSHGRASSRRRSCSARSTRACSTRWSPDDPAGPGPGDRARRGGRTVAEVEVMRRRRARRKRHVRQADLVRDSVRRADVAGDRRRWSALVLHGSLAWVDRQGSPALHLEGVADQRRPQEDRHHVHRAGAGDAAARLRRRDPDARPAGRRDGRAGLPAARALQPDLLGARHDHDLLRRDAVRDRADELRRAAAARRPRRRLPDAQFGRLLADRDRRAAGQHLARRRRVRAHRLAALPAALGARLLARRRRRLLPLVAADLGGGHVAVRESTSSPPCSRCGRPA